MHVLHAAHDFLALVNEALLRLWPAAETHDEISQCWHDPVESSYLSWQQQGAPAYVVRSEDIPSQLVRRLLAQFAGRADYNWRTARSWADFATALALRTPA